MIIIIDLSLSRLFSYILTEFLLLADFFFFFNCRVHHCGVFIQITSIHGIHSHFNVSFSPVVVVVCFIYCLLVYASWAFTSKLVERYFHQFDLLLLNMCFRFILSFPILFTLQEHNRIGSNNWGPSNMPLCRLPRWMVRKFVQ